MNYAETTIKISKKYSKSEREAIAYEFIEHIRRRTAKGLGKNENPFPKQTYSKGYAKSLDFKIAGKSKGRVNLKLSGDMLASVKLLSDSEGEIKIGIPKRDPTNPRAEGNIRGTYGKSRGSSFKAKRFLDIGIDDKGKVLNKFPVRDTEKRLSEVAKILSAIEIAKDGE